MKSKFLLSTVLATIMFFSGCNISQNSSEEEPTTTTTQQTSGSVADGYIEGAKVCIDLNNNEQCDVNEPQATTDSYGNYNISYSGDINGKIITATGGFDLDRRVEFNATLVSVVENNVANVTPFTTFTYFYAQKKGLSFDEAKNDIASILGIPVDKVDDVPVGDDNLEKISLKLQLAVETAAKLKKDSPINIYKLLASKASPDVNLTDLIDNTFTDENIKNAILSIMDQVDKVDVTQLQEIQNNIINIALSANENNTTVSSSTINNSIENTSSTQLNDLNLSEDYFKNLVNSLITEAKIDANNSKVATIDDVRNLVQIIRDTTYEFLDPNLENQENNTSTIAGEIISNYNNAIKPAVDNLSTDVDNSIDLVDEATRQFDKDFNSEFNQSLTDLNNRLSAISNIINEYNITDEYNETTSYNDTISHTYLKDDNGYITETYTLNGKTLTVKYYEDKTENSYLATEPITLNKDGEYEISLNALSFNNGKLEFNLTGTIYDSEDNSHKIDISNATLSFDLNTTQFDNSIDKAFAFSNIDTNIKANVITSNGTFSGDIVLNDANKYLKGVLDYSNFNGVKIDGLLTINASTNDILKIVNDDNLKYRWWDDFVLIDGSPAVEINWSWNNDVEDINLTALNGEVAHCKVTDNYSNGMIYHTVNCDKNVTQYYIGDKVVRANIDGKEVYLENKHYVWNDNDKIIIYYDFKDAFGNTYTISKDNNISVSNIVVQNSTTVLDIPGDIKLSGTIQTPKVNLTLNLTAQSNADGKTYHIIAEDVNFTNGDNFAFVKKLDIGEEKEKYKHLNWFSSFIIPGNDRQYFDPNYNEDNTTFVLLQGLDAKLYDTNENPISINDANVLADLNNNSGYLYGNIAYLDFNMTGFLSLTHINDNNYSSTTYLTIERNGYAPFTLAATSQFNDENSSINAVIQKGDYLLYLNSIYTDLNDTLKVNGYDSNGVFINVEKSSDKETTITITDKDGNSLATFDSKTNTITYNDGSSETLY